MTNNPAGFLYDYDRCDGDVALQEMIRAINSSGYTLISVIQHEHTYTVFFRRPVDG